MRAADAIPAGEWRKHPGEGQWSAAEHAEHLIETERRIVANTDRLMQKGPRPRPFFKRLHVPLVIVEARIFRRKSPFPMDCESIGEKEEMLARLREVRERTLAFMEETRGRDLNQFCMAHPFLGTLTMCKWFEFIASHEIRHTKQMQEIAEALPKTVAKLQK